MLPTAALNRWQEEYVADQAEWGAEVLTQHMGLMIKAELWLLTLLLVKNFKPEVLRLDDNELETIGEDQSIVTQRWHKFFFSLSKLHTWQHRN